MITPEQALDAIINRRGLWAAEKGNSPRRFVPRAFGTANGLKILIDDRFKPSVTYDADALAVADSSSIYLLDKVYLDEKSAGLAIAEKAVREAEEKIREYAGQKPDLFSRLAQITDAPSPEFHRTQPPDVFKLLEEPAAAPDQPSLKDRVLISLGIVGLIVLGSAILILAANLGGMIVRH